MGLLKFGNLPSYDIFEFARLIVDTLTSPLEISTDNYLSEVAEIILKSTIYHLLYSKSAEYYLLLEESI